jgi:N-acetylglutamate synthase-like GNAT family acetyltransferase
VGSNPTPSAKSIIITYLMIRKATQKDLDSIYQLYLCIALDRSRLSDVAYQASIQNNGFLLGREDEKHFEKLIDESIQFLVSEDKNTINGYIVADHRDKYRDDKYKTWFDQTAKERYYSSPQSVSIESLGVKKENFRTGVATVLLRELEKQLKGKGYHYLYSIVTMTPFTNYPSVSFHSKNGFQRISVGRPRRLFDLDNYSSALYFKLL